MQRVDSLEKTLMLGGIGCRRRRGDDRGWDGWMALLTQCICVGWIWGLGDGQGCLVCCDSRGRKESDTIEQLYWTELKRKKKTIKNANIWRLNNTLLNNQQITEEIKNEIKICIEINENENTTTPNLWVSVKAVLRGRFIAIQAYCKKQEKNQINNLTLLLKQLEKKKKWRTPGSVEGKKS